MKELIAQNLIEKCLVELISQTASDTELNNKALNLSGQWKEVCNRRDLNLIDFQTI